MKTLCVGGCGYLGRHVSNLLRDTCIVYDNLMYVSNGYYDEVEFVRGDVTDYPALQKQLNRVDCVIWLAAIVGDAACMINPDGAISTNQAVVRYLAEHFDGPIVFTSSCSVYGINDGIATIDSPLAPVSIYAETKIRAEDYLRKRGNACILRMGTLHGVSQRMRFDLVVNAMTLGAVRNRVIRVYGGHQFRPLLSVKDAADTISNIASTFSPDDIGTFNLASQNLTISEIAEAVQSVVSAAEIQFMKTEYEDKRNYQVEITERFGKLDRTITDSARDVAELLVSGRLHNPLAIHYSNASALGGEFGGKA